MKLLGASTALLLILLQASLPASALTEAFETHDAGLNCTAGACDELEDDEPKCPPDSTPDLTTPGNPCVCKVSRCVQPVCRYSSHRVLKRKGTNEPGDCCDIYECKLPKEKNCSEVICHKEPEECPRDSYRLPSHKAPHDCCSVPQGCQCLPRDCEPAHCSQGQILRQLQDGDGKPGTCCPTYECVESNTDTNCTSGTCEEPMCPSDSTPDFTSPESPCVCEHCEQTTCQHGTYRSLKKKASGIPGDCCDVYDCITPKESSSPCEWKGKRIEHGESFSADSCKVCNCSSGIIFCKNPCPEIPSTCHSITPVGECCPICKHDPPNGCITSVGILMLNGQHWQEDPCTSCTCVKGEKKCTAFMCELSCSNARHEPGECCPICDVWPNHCPPVYCSEECPHGFITDDSGCNTCQCKPVVEKCMLDCPNGFVLDSHGNKLCKCVSIECPPLINCHKNCSHGFRINKAGCEVCRCNQCHSLPLLECNKTCIHGYRTNDKGCHICKCKASPNPVILPSHPMTSTDCKTSDGELHEDGETWFDGCRQCYCHGGVEMCNLITCPALKCSEPVFNSSNSCCPRCADDRALVPATHHTMVCYSVDGVYRVEGETWDLDSCTHCLCHSGWVLCETRQCSPTPCTQPFKRPGQCCAECPLTSLAPNRAKSCAAHRPHGATWWEKNCRSCLCQDGQEQCFTEKCPSLPCDRPVLVKNQCCSMCLDQSPPKTCVFGNATYQVGEEWAEEPCTRCKCIDGEQVCKPKLCPNSCSNPIRVPDRCCPVCPDSSKLASRGLLGDSEYLAIIAVLLFIVLCLVVSVWWLCHRDSFPPPGYSSTDQQAKCEPYQYKYVSTYDTQQFNLSPSFGDTEKTALAPV